VTVAQFIPSQAVFGEPGKQIRISQTTDPTAGTTNFTSPGETTRFVTELAIASDQPGKWTLRIRQPNWALGPGEVSVDGVPLQAAVSKKGFLEIDREWKAARVKVSFAKRVTREPLPGDKQRFALLDGPVVLAALSDKEPELMADGAITPQYEHEYMDGREWQTGHYWARTRLGTVVLKPLYEVADENYCVYFTQSP